MEWQRNDRLGRVQRHHLFEHRRKVLRAIWSNFHAHTDAHGNGNRYAYSNTDRNSHCDTESNCNADAYTYTNVLADGNTYGYGQRFPRYSGKHLYAFARGDGR
jgi:hypothetical protein